MPSSDAMLVTKIDISIACERKKTTAPVRITATKPRLSGSSAAATDPNTASRMMNTIGKPADSAFSRSDFETSCRPLHSACWPTRWIGTAPSLHTSAFLRTFTAASTLWSVSPVTCSGISTIAWSPAPLAAATAAGETATPSTPLTDAGGLVDRGAERARVLVLVVEDEDQRLGLHAREPLQEVGHSQRARTGDLEAARRQVLGLLRGERQRRERG